MIVTIIVSFISVIPLVIFDSRFWSCSAIEWNLFGRGVCLVVSAYVGCVI